IALKEINQTAVPQECQHLKNSRRAGNRPVDGPPKNQEVVNQLALKELGEELEEQEEKAEPSH
ncbi:hypothetical protein KIL84_001273, partial [Mauremys mutica]